LSDTRAKHPTMPSSSPEENALRARPIDKYSYYPAQHLAHGSVCPRCNAPVDRVRRRVIDRLLSLFTPVQRYRCHAMDCDWEGNLPQKSLKRFFRILLLGAQIVKPRYTRRSHGSG